MEAAEQLRGEVTRLKRAWSEAGIDTRMIAGIERADDVASVLGGDVVAPGSKERMDEAVQKLGPEATLESLVLDERFRDLFPDHVRQEAAERLNR